MSRASEKKFALQVYKFVRKVYYLSMDTNTDWLTEEMNRQARAGIPNLDNLGDGTMEYDGPRCVDLDCRRPVDNDNEMCEECSDQPHEFQHDGSRFDNCVCGRIRSIAGYSPVH